MSVSITDRRVSRSFVKLAVVSSLSLTILLAVLVVWKQRSLMSLASSEKELQKSRNAVKWSLDQQAGPEMKMLFQILDSNNQEIRKLSNNLYDSWGVEEEEEEDQDSLPPVNTPIQSYEPSLESVNLPQYVFDGGEIEEEEQYNIVEEFPAQQIEADRNQFVDGRFPSRPLSQTSRDFRDVPSVRDTSRGFARGLGQTRSDIRASQNVNIRDVSRGFGRGLRGSRDRRLSRRDSFAKAKSFPSRRISNTSQTFRDTPNLNEVSYPKLDENTRFPDQFSGSSSSSSSQSSSRVLELREQFEAQQQEFRVPQGE